MPVDDHPIHERTREGVDARWGCWGRERYADGYFAPNRAYRPDGLFVDMPKWIENGNSKTCKNDISATDPKCAGCRNRKTLA